MESKLMDLKIKFNAAYMIACEELPFTKFTSQVLQLKKNGLDVSKTYNSKKKTDAKQTDHDWWQKKITAFGADGAAVNMGVSGGVGALLREEIGEHILSFHCCDLPGFNEELNHLIDKTVDITVKELERRFEMMRDNTQHKNTKRAEIIRCFSVFCHDSWPDDIHTFGENEIDTLPKWYRDILLKNAFLDSGAVLSSSRLSHKKNIFRLD
ncbi:hypothetical protein Q7C36_003510 [Tachysurus vachellii]|uniref:Uncharacterized protein n=1 Tax=Tachysurus vachellii TaxID=175792 RepID=A0AA88NTM2_TACVA|nr:hypothetical protein Q7C36_003510 [Tachysurus vachellii]